MSIKVQRSGGMACTRRSICRLCKSGLVFRPAVSQTRSYALNYKQPKEERLAYARYRRQLTALRKQYQEELQEQKKMSMEAFNAQAAKEAQMERDQEAHALEENKRELERMAKKRAWAMATREEALQKKREAGEIARQAWEQQLTDKRAKQVISLQEKSHEFITLDNLDEKIQEVIENEVNYNFVLTRFGKKMIH